MTEYRPKVRRSGINPPWGYEPSKEDPNILLPDKFKLNALEHSFRMRAKHKTSIRDCCMWLQANTGDSLSPAGYMYAYDKWMKQIRQTHMKEVHKAVKNRKEQAEELFKGFTVTLDDRESVYALAEKQEEKNSKKIATR